MAKFHYLLYPQRLILVTTLDANRKPNIITIDRLISLSSEPKLIGICLSPKRYSCDLIRSCKEFGVNIPGEELKEATSNCGRTSGRETDKFKENNLTPEQAKIIKPPLIKECLASFECRLVQEIPLGERILFVGEIVEIHERKSGKGLYRSGKEDLIVI